MQCESKHSDSVQLRDQLACLRVTSFSPLHERHLALSQHGGKRGKPGGRLSTALLGEAGLQ